MKYHKIKGTNVPISRMFVNLKKLFDKFLNVFSSEAVSEALAASDVCNFKINNKVGSTCAHQGVYSHI